MRMKLTISGWMKGSPVWKASSVTAAPSSPVML